MTTRRPPRLATALLCRLAEPTETVLGDLVEQFQSGKSTLWYWRQVASIIAQKVVRDIRQSPAVVVAVMPSGPIPTVIAPTTITAIQHIIGFDRWLFVRGFGWFYLNGYGLPRSMATHPWWIATAFYVLLGWCVGRISQSRQAAAVSMFASSVFFSDLALLSYHLTTHPVDFDSAYNLTQLIVFTVVILPLAALFGGMSAHMCGSNQRGVIA
jgi:hypothetical protein